MPNLRKLEVENGYFGLRTADLFNPVETIILNCKTDPNSSDIFSEEQLPVLKYCTLGKADMKFNADKPTRLLRQLAEGAVNLQKLSCDLMQTMPKLALEKIIRERPSLISLKVEGLGTDQAGIAYLDMLAEVDNLKKLNLGFNRLFEQVISKHKVDHFPVNGNQSIETLKVKLQSNARP